LRVYQRPYGRISGLNCWEHNMMLPGYALAAQGTQIHIAAWPGREPISAPPAAVPLWPRQLLLSRAFASQAGCYVIAVGGMRSHADTPERYRELSTIEYTGDSCIIDPRGEIVAGPATGETILIAEGSRQAVLAAKAVCDIGGHYARPDILRLIVDRNPQERVIDCDIAGRTEPQMWE
jgi:predicted amidohydrolase